MAETSTMMCPPLAASDKDDTTKTTESNDEGNINGRPGNDNDYDNDGEDDEGYDDNECYHDDNDDGDDKK